MLLFQMPVFKMTFFDLDLRNIDQRLIKFSMTK